MDQQEFEEWLVQQENEHLEFKEAKNTYDFEETVRYCVALANEGGGTLILGVKDKIPREVCGSKAFLNLERTKALLIEKLRLRVNVEDFKYNGKRVIVFNVPSRPIGMPLQYKGAYLMRGGESLLPMTPDMLQRIFIEAQPDFSAEICAGASINQETQFSFSVEDLLVMDLINRKETLPQHLYERCNVLKSAGVIEKVGRGRGSHYILSKRFYQFTQKRGSYTRNRGLDRSQNKALILEHLKHYKKGTFQEFQEVLPALSANQIKTLLRDLKKEKFIAFEGSRKSGYWKCLQ